MLSTAPTVKAITVPSPANSLQALPPGTSLDISPQLDAITLMFRDFRTIAGENPVGTNAEIMRAIMGENARHATLGPPPTQQVNGDGELVDPWGTPYFFHQISGQEMEVRSAGPDRKLWTPDDQSAMASSGATRPPR